MPANHNYQFVQTRDMFREYLSGYPTPLTYEDWKSAAEEDKAALLYVTFYQEVTLAWFNAIVSRNIAYVTAEDAVSTVLQYLMKNVSIIMNDPTRYSSNYLYRVCYNCIGCLPRTDSEKMRNASDISNIYVENDVEVNLWDLVPSEDDDLETQQTKEAIWNIIRHMGPKAEKVVNHLINPTDTLHKISGKSIERSTDRLADVSVTMAEFEEILAELKVKLAPYKDILITF